MPTQRTSPVTPPRPRALWLGCLLAMASLALSARAQSVASPVPANGTTGTLITLDIVDLGAKPPKVWLTRDDTKKRTRLTLVSASPTQLTLLLKKAPPAGLYDLTVKPKGGDELALDEAFAVLVPQDLELDSAATTPDHHVTVRGSFLGTKKGKLRIGGKPAKVLLWQAVAGGDDPDVAEPAIGVVVAVVPKSLPDGTYPVEVTTHAGSALSDGALTLVGSDKPTKLKKPLFSAQLGDGLVATTALEHLASGAEHRVTAWLPTDLGDATATLRLRFFLNTSELPVPLAQTGFTAFVDYERPLDGGGSESFHSATCVFTVTHLEDGVVAGQLEALLVSDLDESTLLLQAGLLVTPAPGPLDPPGPGPAVASFTGSPAAPLAGETVSFSWATSNADEHLTSCAILLPGATASVPCPTTGSVEVTALNGGTLQAKLFVYDAGVFSDSAVAQVSVGGPLVTIIEPGSLERFDGAVSVEAHVTSALYELTSVTASVGPLSIDLVGSAGSFTGSLPLESLTPGDQLLTVMAVDALGTTSQATRLFDYDIRPVLEVSLPTDLQVATPEILVQATGHDPDGDAVTLKVRLHAEGQAAQTLVTATDTIDTTLDLSAWDGQSVQLRVQVLDEAGWLVEQWLDLLVEGSPALAALIEAPGLIVDLDEAGTRVGFLDETVDPPSYAALELLTQIVTPIPLTPGFDVLEDLDTSVAGSLRFTPTGAVYLARPQGTSWLETHLFDWNAGDLITLSESLGSLRVDGDYASFDENFDPDGLVSRRRFTVQSLVTQVGDVYSSDHDVDANGDVAWARADDPVQTWLKPKGSPEIPLGSASGAAHVGPRLDAGRVLYVRKQPITATLGELLLSDGISEVVVREHAPFNNPDGDYAVRGDWIAFNREGLSGQAQLWVRDLAGLETKVSPFVADCRLESLAPDGSLTFTAGDRRYRWSGDGEPEDMGSKLGRALWRDGEWYVLLGTTLFHAP